VDVGVKKPEFLAFSLHTSEYMVMGHVMQNVGLNKNKQKKMLTSQKVCSIY